MNTPEFIIRIGDEPTPRPIQFEDILPIQDDILSLTLLWDTNSYMVSRDRRFFIINGGRKVSISEFKDCRDLKIFYRRRVSVKLTVGNEGTDKEEKTITYLLGFEGTVKDEIKHVFIQIASDGSRWIWRDKK